VNLKTTNKQFYGKKNYSKKGILKIDIKQTYFAWNFLGKDVYFK
jgi:hypothetical protein